MRDAASPAKPSVDITADTDGGLCILPVHHLPEISAGDDLPQLIQTALHRSDIQLRDGDILVVASKIVAKAQGRTLPADQREQAISQQSQRIVASRRVGRENVQIVQSVTGPVLAAAGVDASNVPGEHILLLPENPDTAAQSLRETIQAGDANQAPVRLGVIISDTLGRPWRLGQTDTAIGAAGVQPLLDLSGSHDTHGHELQVTQRAIADELAAAADLVKGKATNVAVAVIRGLDEAVAAADEQAPGATALLRDEAHDWFRYGHVEAIQASLGMPPGTPQLPATPALADGLLRQLERSVAIAMASPTWPRPEAQRTGSWVRLRIARHPTGVALVHLRVVPPSSWHSVAALGALAQRIIAIAWAQGLTAAIAEADTDSTPVPPSLTIRAQLRTSSSPQ